MYTTQVRIRGTVPLLQHRFAPEQLGSLMQRATRPPGATDYSSEWSEGMYATADGHLHQPATHLEGALVKAAATFKIKGGGGKTWKDPIRAYCYVLPEQILHLRDHQPVKAPSDDLLTYPTDYLSVSMMRVIVQRSAVARARLQIAAGWELAFALEVYDPQVSAEVVEQILREAGRAVGIGDFRPRYGRFEVIQFEVSR
jgi:hypothetical protein